MIAFVAKRVGPWPFTLLCLAGLSTVPRASLAGPTPQQVCAGNEARAAGLSVFAKSKCYAKALLVNGTVDGACLMHAEHQLAAALSRAKGCGDDPGTVSAKVDACLAAFTTAITGNAQCVATKIKAVGRDTLDKAKCQQAAFRTGASSSDLGCVSSAEAALTRAIGKADRLGTCTATASALAFLVDGCLATPLTVASTCDPDTGGGTCSFGQACVLPFFSLAYRCSPSCYQSGASASMCGGTCPLGQVCGQVFPGAGFCECVSADSTCEIAQAPACGGTCLNGEVCGQGTGGSTACECVPPDNTCGISQAPTCGGTCPNGQVCGQGTGTNFCTCVPPDNTCGISQAPTCGGTCPTRLVCGLVPGATSCTCVVPGCVAPSGTFCGGDGTVYDGATDLTWEKKDTAVGSGVNPADLHDVDNQYSWAGCCNGDCSASANYCQPNATAAATCAAQTGGAAGCGQCGSGDGSCQVTGITTVWDWINQVNAANFGGHGDWRLPTIAGCCGYPTGQAAELESIVKIVHAPAIDPIFGPTVGYLYSSASTNTANPFNAWSVDFSSGALNAFYSKNNAYYFRAMRPGS